MPTGQGRYVVIAGCLATDAVFAFLNTSLESKVTLGKYDNCFSTTFPEHLKNSARFLLHALTTQSCELKRKNICKKRFTESL